MLHLIHKLSHVVRHWIHAQCVKTAVEHVGLDAHLVKWLTECPYGIVWVLACQEVDLFESTSISLNSGEAAHVDYYRSYSFQLVFTWLKLAGRLPHVSIDKTKLDFLFHIS